MLRDDRLCPLELRLRDDRLCPFGLRLRDDRLCPFALNISTPGCRARLLDFFLSLASDPYKTSVLLEVTVDSLFPDGLTNSIPGLFARLDLCLDNFAFPSPPYKTSRLLEDLLAPDDR